MNAISRPVTHFEKTFFEPARICLNIAKALPYPFESRIERVKMLCQVILLAPFAATLFATGCLLSLLGRCHPLTHHTSVPVAHQPRDEGTLLGALATGQRVPFDSFDSDDGEQKVPDLIPLPKPTDKKALSERKTRPISRRGTQSQMEDAAKEWTDVRKAFPKDPSQLVAVPMRWSRDGALPPNQQTVVTIGNDKTPINANRVLDGKAIACVTPKIAARKEFWQMIHDQQVRCIFDLQDGLDIYWPEGANNDIILDDITITYVSTRETLRSVNDTEKYKVKENTFNIEDKEGNVKRQVTHFQILGWKDLSPQFLANLVDFANLANNVAPEQNTLSEPVPAENTPPFVVMCKTATKRTSQFLFVYEFYQQLKHGIVDPDPQEILTNLCNPATGRAGSFDTNAANGTSRLYGLAREAGQILQRGATLD